MDRFCLKDSNRLFNRVGGYIKKNACNIVKLVSVSFILQVFTVSSKALLLFTMLCYLEVEDVGLFGVMVTTINLGMYAVGMELHICNRRKILNCNIGEVPCLIRDQFILHGVLYSVVLPLLLLVFSFGILPSRLLLWFYVLLILDHITQEFQRILVTLHRPAHAAAVFFIRGGAWVYVIGLMMWQHESARQLYLILGGWMVGTTIGLIMAIFWLRDLDWRNALTSSVNWDQLRVFAKAALPFLCANMSLIMIYSIDKLGLQYFWDLRLVGVYTLYSFSRNAIQSILDMSIFNTLQPRIVAAYQNGKIYTYRCLLRQMALWIGLGSIILGIAAVLMIYLLIGVLNKAIYIEYLDVYWIIIITIFIEGLGYIPHTVLYVRHLDGQITFSSVLGLGIGIISNLTLIPLLGLPGAAWATLLAIVGIFVCRVVFCWKCRDTTAKEMAILPPIYNVERELSLNLLNKRDY